MNLINDIDLYLQLELNIRCQTQNYEINVKYSLKRDIISLLSK